MKNFLIYLSLIMLGGLVNHTTRFFLTKPPTPPPSVMEETLIRAGASKKSAERGLEMGDGVFYTFDVYSKAPTNRSCIAGIHGGRWFVAAVGKGEQLSLDAMLKWFDSDKGILNPTPPEMAGALGPTPRYMKMGETPDGVRYELTIKFPGSSYYSHSWVEAVIKKAMDDENLFKDVKVTCTLPNPPIRSETNSMLSASKTTLFLIGSRVRLKAWMDGTNVFLSSEDGDIVRDGDNWKVVVIPVATVTDIHLTNNLAFGTNVTFLRASISTNKSVLDEWGLKVISEVVTNEHPFPLWILNSEGTTTRVPQFDIVTNHYLISNGRRFLIGQNKCP